MLKQPSLIFLVLLISVPECHFWCVKMCLKSNFYQGNVSIGLRFVKKQSNEKKLPFECRFRPAGPGLFYVKLLTFNIVSVDPVENIESSVRAEGKEVVGRDGLGFASLLDHEQLGKDGHRLQVDGEGPEDLHEGELVVKH